MSFDCKMEKKKFKKTKKSTTRHRLQFGMAVRRQRESLGLSQERLAEIADVHHNFVGLIERGQQNLSIDSMVKFAKALKVKLADLFDDAGL